MSKGQKVRRHHGSGNTALQKRSTADYSISAQTGHGSGSGSGSKTEEKEKEKRGPGFWFAIFAILTVIAAFYSGSMRIYIPVTIFAVVATALFEINISRYPAARGTIISGIELAIIGIVGTLAMTSSGTPENGSVAQLIMFVFEFWLMFGICEIAVGGLVRLFTRKR